MVSWRLRHRHLETSGVDSLTCSWRESWWSNPGHFVLENIFDACYYLFLCLQMPSAKTNESQHLGMGNTCFVLCALFRFYCCKWFGNLKGTLNSLILSLLYLITAAMWGMAYDVNFDSMTQQNVKTSKVRSIRRVLKPNEAVFPKLRSKMFWIG